MTIESVKILLESFLAPGVTIVEANGLELVLRKGDFEFTASVEESWGEFNLEYSGTLYR